MVASWDEPVNVLELWAVPTAGEVPAVKWGGEVKPYHVRVPLIALPAISSPLHIALG